MVEKYCGQRSAISGQGENRKTRGSHEGTKTRRRVLKQRKRKQSHEDEHFVFRG